MSSAESKTVTLTIDGREVSVPEGATILDAARKLEIPVPTLCHNQALAPYGSCWVCAVKVEGARTLVPSCSTKAREGMIVHSEDPEVRQTRRVCLELLLSDHHGDCLGPCQEACPAGIDVQGYIAHAAKGEYAEAIRLVKQKNPLPLICGRVCPRPCEENCRRNLVDEPVAVDAIKRYLADWDRSLGADRYVPPRAERTGRRVAVVGGGPAGLTCAYFLSARGHDVTIFEALPRLGGMLIWGIPAYRLPRDVLDAEIEMILSLGVEAKCDQRLGRDFSIQDLKDDGFDAVFLGLGATESRRLRVEGEDLDGVLSGTDFLRRFGLGETFDFAGKRVVVVGGGNTAIDAARTSLRLGAESVTILYRRGRAEMPAQDEEVEEAEEEGVRFHFLAAPTKLTGSGSLTGVEYTRMELGEPDASGRRRPQPVEGSEETLQAGICIAAIGQIPDLASVDEAGLEKTDWRTLSADEKSLATNLDGVFAGGDCVHGAATVVEAVAHGREGAVSIDQYLRGEPVERDRPIFNIAKGDWRTLDPADFEHFLRAKRQPLSCLSAEARIGGFEEIMAALTDEQVGTEAARCLQCGCDSVYDCRVRQYATEYDAEPERFAGEARREVPDQRHPLIRLETQKCILCGACVRVCDEVRDVRALGFVGRGFGARIRPAFGESLLDAGCTSCGACVDVCPTGAIVETLGPGGGPFEGKAIGGACTGCGVGCGMQRHVTEGGRLVRVSPAEGDPSAGSLCLRGHFGHRALRDEDRILAPMIRRDGELVQTDLPTALARAAELLQGGPAPSVLVSPHTTVEEIGLAQGIAASLGSNARSLTLQSEAPALAGLGEIFDAPIAGSHVGAIGHSDCVLAVELDAMDTHPVAGVRLLGVARRGRTLISVKTGAARSIERHATLALHPAANTAPAAVAGIVRELLSQHGAGAALPADLRAAITDALAEIPPEAVERAADVTPFELAEAARRLAGAERPLIVFDATRAGPRLARIAGLLAAVLRGQGDEELPLVVLRRAADSVGAWRCGVEALDGADLTPHPALVVREDVIAASHDRGMTDLPGALVVADAVWSPTAAAAEVVLPLPAPHELAGHAVSSGGLRMALETGVRPAAGDAAEATLQELARRMDAAIVSAGTEAPPAVRGDAAEALADPLATEALRGEPVVADSFTRRFRAWAHEEGLATRPAAAEACEGAALP